MFKEVLKIAFEDLGLKSLPIRGIVDHKNGIVEDMTIFNYKRHYELQYLEPSRIRPTSIGFTLGDTILFESYYFQINSNDVRRFYREFQGGLCIRLPFTDETVKSLINRKIKGFYVSSDKDLDIAYLDTSLVSNGLNLFATESNKFLVCVKGNSSSHLEFYIPDKPEIRIYSF